MPPHARSWRAAAAACARAHGHILLFVLQYTPSRAVATVALRTCVLSPGAASRDGQRHCPHWAHDLLWDTYLRAAPCACCGARARTVKECFLKGRSGAAVYVATGCRVPDLFLDVQRRACLSWCACAHCQRGVAAKYLILWLRWVPLVTCPGAQSLVRGVV